MNKTTFLFFTLLFSLNLFAQETTVTSFTLVNADTDTDIIEITTGVEINLLEYPGVEFNIRANTSADVKSVRLQLSGTLLNTATESVAPYALYGDFPVGDYYGQVFPVGSYTIAGTPYSEASAGGTEGQPLTINFDVVEKPLQRPFITTWKTVNPGSSEDNQITIPTFPGEAYNYSVNWGDGTSDSGVAGDMTHTYETPGTYQVSISGDFPRIYFHNNLDSNYRPGLGDKDKLIEINQWGDMQWTSMKYAFYGCTNMNVVATDTPDFSNLFSLSFMFNDCKTLVGNETFADWNVSNVNNISFMFSGAELFNEDIGGWDTSNVLYMQSMFSFTNAFNQPIGQWDFSNARSIDAMFLNATAFNQDIGSWKFPNVTELPNMFNGATSFNQDISTWDVAAVTNFGAFLANASSFDQDLSTWEISNATELGSIFFNSGLSDENYDKILIGWSQLPTLQNDVRMDAPQNAYCNAVDERQFIIDTYGWTINDLGQAFNCGPNQQRPFVMVWKTDNAGTSEANQITIPTFAGETYNYFVDWGDGTSAESVLGGITHTYPNPGTYTISIIGEFPRIHFDDSGDKRKLLRVEQWGDISWKSMESAFNGCTLMDVTAKDVPNFSLLSSMKGMFRGCSSLVGNSFLSNWDTATVEDMSDLFRNASLFNQFVGNWDVGNVKYMNYMFANASSFDQNLSLWKVVSVEDMDSMLDGTILSVLNYDRTLIAWNNLDTLQQNVRLGGGGLSYCKSANARESIIDIYKWSIFDDMRSTECPTLERPFVTTWKTDNLGSSNSNQITIPTASFETYDFTVEWGDGTISENVTESITHTYATPGIYEIAISGFYPTPYFNNAATISDVKKLITIEQWGDIQWSTMGSAFRGCENMDVVATDLPDFSNVKSTTAMFAHCKSLVGNSSFGGWDMSQVTFTSNMFQDAELFNQDISSWDMGSVEFMHSMFQKATNFNQPIGLWDVSKVTLILGLFDGATSFNQPLNDWNISSVSNLFGLFNGASSFNQPLDNWDVGHVTDMNNLFYGATAFDQDLSSWNVSQVQSMGGMFWGARLSRENYDRILNSWSTQTLQNEIHFNAGNSQYCLGEAARQKLIDDFGWTITDGGKAEGCEEPQRPFITTWKTDNPGSSEDNQITIPTRLGEIYNYIVDWGDGTSDSGVTGDITHTYETPGTYQVSITGNFPSISFSNDQTERLKIVSVNQWGDINWKSMTASFSGCINLGIVAQDAPNLSEVSDLFSTFTNCTSLTGNESFDNWDVGTITNMTQTFTNCIKFNADISGWDVSNVTKMFNLFDNCPSFNRDISGWDVGKVTDMGFMFSFASAFNQDIGDWNVANVTNMRGMFQGDENSKFNQDIGDWDVSQVTDMSQMFVESVKFNQNLDRWDVGRVESMRFMFGAASSFDQDLSSWDISAVKDLTGMFFNIELSTENYDNALNVWSKQTLQSGVTFDGGNSQYCLGEAARQKLIDDFGWTIADGGIASDCNPCPTTQITLSTQQQVDDFAINYDIANCTFKGGILIEGTDILNLDGLSGLTYIEGFLNIVNTQLTNVDGLSSLIDIGTAILIENNSRLLDISGLSSITFLNSLIISDNELLTNVDGLSSLTSISTFSISNNAILTNIDGLASLTHVGSDLVIQNNTSLPNLDGLSSLKSISDSFILKNNASLTDIDGLSSLVLLDDGLSIEMNPMLTNVDGLSSLNGTGLSLSIQSNMALTNLDGLASIIGVGVDLTITNNDALTNIYGLSNLNYIGRELNISGNNVLSDCAINAVCDSDVIVGGTVTIFGNTGDCADISAATVACVEVIEGNADLLAATYLQGSKNPMPTGPILRVEEGNRETYLKFDMSNFTGDVTAARLEMQVSSDPGNGFIQVFLGDNSNWTETGLNGSNKPMVVGAALASISGTHGLGQTKVWDIDVSNLSTGGELTLIVKHSNGNDVAFASDETSQAPQLLITSRSVPEVQRPFVTTWKTDNPGVSEDNQITIPTYQEETYDYIVDWGDGTSDFGITGNITHTYQSPGTYQVSISGEFPLIFFNNINNVDNYGDEEKILEINQWGDIVWGNVSPIFAGCHNLNMVATDIPNFSQTEQMGFMFAWCNSLIGNASMNNWDVGNIRTMSSLFRNATLFNQDIGKWDMKNTYSTSFMFAYAEEFNQDIGDWNVGKVKLMHSMFRNAAKFNQDIGNWDVSKANNMQSMFIFANGFNRDIGNWDVTNVTDMSRMFYGASSFDQNLGNWNIVNASIMGLMFHTSALSVENYDSTLIGWSTQQLQNGVVFDGGNSQYCQSETARQKLIDDFGWTITDGGKAIDCVEVVEGVADLIDATYLQGSSNPFPEGPILRAEEGNRVSYMKFDLSAFNRSIGQAQLKMQVASDPGSGTLEVFLGSDSNWTENNLNGTNKPTAVGRALASISGTHGLGQTKTWNLDVSQIPTGGLLTLIVKHSNGNDVAFASDETNQAPELIITSQGAASRSANTLGLSPNPTSNEVAVGFEVPVQVGAIFVYDISGKLVQEVAPNQVRSVGDYPMDVSNLPSGMYFVRTFDADGVPHQKPMVIKH